MVETEASVQVARRIRGMLREYMYRKAEGRTGEKRDQFPVVEDERGRKRVQESERFREACQKVCEDAFLAMRSRKTREEFATYFIGTICAVPQRLSQTDFLELNQQLFEDGEGWHQVKSLAMLAVSGFAYRDSRDAAESQTTQDGEQE